MENNHEITIDDNDAEIGARESTGFECRRRRHDRNLDSPAAICLDIVSVTSGSLERQPAPLAVYC